MKVYLALFKSNLRLTMRDRSVLFFNYLFPLIFFFTFAELFHAGTGQGVSYFVGTVLTMGILGNGLWGAGMRSVQEREANILRRFKVTPITPLPLLVASMVSGWLLYLPVIFLITGLARVLYHMPLPTHWFSLLMMASLGVCSFRSVGLILAAVTNTMAEANIFIQLLYMPMLFLSGTTIPSSILPSWAQTLAEFMPATYLVSGFQGIFFRNQSLLDNGRAVGALLLTMAMGLFLAVKLFRWEKEEKIAPRNRLWVAGVLAPFLILGCWEIHTNEHIGRNAAMLRDLERSGSFVVRNARVFLGDGEVRDNATVLVQDGKITGVYDGGGPEADKFRVEVIQGLGKTLLPGLVDTHAHLTPPGGVLLDAFNSYLSTARHAAALLYCGVTFARSAGDTLNDVLRLRGQIAEGSKLGADFVIYGPMFTAEGGPGTEYLSYVPLVNRPVMKPQMLRLPATPEEARRQVRELKASGVNGIKAMLGAIDPRIFRALAEEAHAQKLPLSVETSDAREVAEAVDAGAVSIEHGGWRDALPDELLARMARQRVYLNPGLAGAEGAAQFFSGKADSADTSLVQQVVSANFLRMLHTWTLEKKGVDPEKAAIYAKAVEQARSNLLRAWKAGVPLAIGSDSGNPLVYPGWSLHRELQLWVQAGIPPAVALQAATGNAAALLGQGDRIGGIRKGMQADLLLVDGNPLQDIAATERISVVVFKGERIQRSELFDQK